ncbi:Inner membrane protein YqiK [Devosia equisanguinis]|uniref:Inner membrane protein YqiK n=1 Tax=Devosia equisanguinis TaxID=2490941 RepID=A0A447IE63_9HYPH|nr:flotillin domain-containing protein [Devosia equisanguinis]VDS05766.1 Inner membrane protein YqiK [Devosia equisanguinis]
MVDKVKTKPAGDTIQPPDATTALPQPPIEDGGQTSFDAVTQNQELPAMSQPIYDILITIAVILVALFAIGLIFSRLYRRSSKEVSFVRTGFGGQKVIMNGGALVFPVLHEQIPVNMNTLRLEVRRAADQALITKDRMRVDVQAEFYVRVQPVVESIANAAQTLGRRTMEPAALKELVEGKFVDALRAVAAEMAMEELHEQRVNFVQKVQAAVSEDILKNGLELESVSLTGLDQTNREFFNPDNAFDAEGLTKLTQAIEERRKTRNDIEQETQVLIERKNLEAEAQKYQIARDKEFARLEQEREIQIRLAEQSALIKQQQSEREREAEEARIRAAQQVRQADIAAEQVVKEREIATALAVEAAAVEKAKQIALAEQARDIAVSIKSKEKSQADAAADEARAVAAKAAEEVSTARQTAVAEREKAIQLIEARKAAEQQAISVTVAAEAEKAVASDRAEALRIAAQADAEQAKLRASGQAEAEKLKAEALAATYQVEAEGKRNINEASNTLSPEQIAMQVRIKLIEALPQIIAESVKPMQNIDGIKILHVDGLNGAGGNAAGGGDGASGPGSGGLADQAVAAALRYRSQAPLIDALMSELGLSGGTLDGLASSVTQANPAAPKGRK